MDIIWSDTVRKDRFHKWLQLVAPAYGLVPTSVRAASADASFRRYFRIDSKSRQSFIIMDAPPDKENSRPFIEIADLLHDAGLFAPRILNWDEPNGFMLLTDLGTQTMMDVIDKQNAVANLPLYEQAIDALIAWQLTSKPNVLPPYDEALLMRELQLFPDWYIAKHRGITLNAAQQATLDAAFKLMVQNNLTSPQVFVHRDFMPRNLMVPYAHLATNQLGVLDFQDAVYGPITYDIASLMRDAFLSWDEDFVLDVTVRYWQKAKTAGLAVGDDFGDFYQRVEWMGLQRHIKILGIFARLTLRDGKPKYLADTPRFIAYLRSTCSRYMALKPLLRLVENIEGIKPEPVFVFGRG
jgi:N-acetylmuramate 1-kinase